MITKLVLNLDSIYIKWINYKKDANIIDGGCKVPE